MRRIASVAAALVVLSAPPVFAAVKITQGVAIGSAMLTVTSQREVNVLTAPGRPARLMGRLPRNSSSLVSDGMAAWAVTTGERRPTDVRLFQVHPAAQAVLELRAGRSPLGERVTVQGVAGADELYVYLSPDLRFDLTGRRLEREQLTPFPDLEILKTVRRGGETWYLARDRAPGDGEVVRLWLLHSDDPSAAARDDQAGWLRAEAGAASGPVELKADKQNLFLVFEEGRVLRFDRGSLRLAEDLAPMLRPGRIRFFAADERNYWVGLEAVAKIADDGTADDAEEDGDDPGAVSLWQIDRSVLDGGVFHAGDLPLGFRPLAASQDRILFGSVTHRRASPLVTVSSADGASQAYGIRGLHARRWASFGHGLQGAGVVLLEGGFVAVVVGVATLPVWIWFV